MYLLDENEKSQLMREKVTFLLESREANNLLLAFNLLEGGGVPDIHVPYLVFWVLNFRYENYEMIENPLKKVLKKTISKNDYKFLEKNDFFNDNYEFNDVNMFHNLVKMETQMQPSINIEQVALLFFIHENTARKYILTKEIRPDLWYLIINEYNWVYFNEWDLSEIPPQIQDLKFLGLNLSYCNFEEIPDFLGKTNFHYIDFDEGSVDKKLIKELEKKCPNQMAGYYYNKAWQFADKCKNEENPTKKETHYKKAHKLLKKSVTLDLNFGESWHWLGIIERHKNQEQCLMYFDKTFQAYQNMIHYYTQNPDFLGRHSISQLYYWQSCVLALQKREDEAFERLEKAINLDISHKDEAIGDDDWDFYRDTERFKKMVGL